MLNYFFILEIYSSIATSYFYFLSLFWFIKSLPPFLQVHKNVFVVFYSGERVKSKILKICDAFGANRYPFSDDLSKQFQTIREVYVIFPFRFLISFKLLLSAKCFRLLHLENFLSNIKKNYIFDM